MATMTQPAPGMRVKKTTYTEIEPKEDRAPSDAKPSPFYDRDWEIVVQTLSKEDWLGHKMRVYRAGEKWERGSAPIDNIFKAPFTEDDLRARFGGGKYVLWLYGPPKEQNLVGKYQVELDGAPIINSTPRNGGSPGSESVALEAMRMYSNPEFIRMQMQMMVTAATEAMALIKSQIPAQQNPLETLRTAKEILGVGASPEHGLLDTIRVLKELGIVGSPEKKGVEEILSLITTLKTSGLIQSGAPKADLAATFANNLPMLVDRMVSGLHEFRLRAEAEERVIRMQRGEIKPGDPNVITVQPGQESPNAPATAAAAATAAAPSATATNGAVTPEMAQAIIAQSRLHQIVDGLKQPDATGEGLYHTLEILWPEILDELVKFSKEQLLAFFASRDSQMQYFGCDILTQVANDPRLPKMIEDFLKIAKAAADSEKVATTSTAVV